MERTVDTTDVEYDSQTSREHGREICRRIKNRVAERIPKKWKASVSVPGRSPRMMNGKTSIDVCSIDSFGTVSYRFW